MKTKLGLLASAAVLFLVGCGDETTNFTGMPAVANLQEAGKCAAGDMVMNLEDSQVYICGADNKWGVLKGEKGEKGDQGEKGTDGANGTPGAQGLPGVKGDDGTSCTARVVNAGVEVSCGGMVLDTLRNGADGNDGAPGAPGAQGLPGVKGEDGSSCTASPVTNGVEIYCGDQLVMTILNGQDGAPGASCSGRTIDEVGVEISCGGVVVDTLRNGAAQDGGTSSIASSSSSSSSNSSTSLSSSANTNLAVDAGEDMVCYNNTVCAFIGTASNRDTGAQVGAGSIKKYLWDYEGDGVFDDSSATNSFNHAYADTAVTATYTARFCARDDDDNEVCDTTHVSVTNRAPNLTGYILATLLAGNQFALSTDSLRFTDEDNNLQPVLYWDLNDDGIFETVRRAADTVVLVTNGGNLPSIAVYSKDRWGASSDTLSAIQQWSLCGTVAYHPESQFCDTRDSTIYRFVKIGNQKWMAQNLNYEQRMGVYPGGNCCYKNNAQYCVQCGRLYTWGNAMDSVTTGCGAGKGCWGSNYGRRVKGVCPDGWHLPDSTEWDTLFTAVGGQFTAGTVLKTSSEWSNNSNGIDAYGFSALPCGYRGPLGGFQGKGTSEFFWSSSAPPDQSLNAYAMHLYYYYEDASLPAANRSYAYAVRCVKD